MFGDKSMQFVNDHNVKMKVISKFFIGLCMIKNVFSNDLIMHFMKCIKYEYF